MARQHGDDHPAIREHRMAVQSQLFRDDRRTGEGGKPCEGSLFLPHECSRNIELNEVLFPRNVFQKKNLGERLQFYHAYNCALNCDVFHKHLKGHSTEYRDWHLQRVFQVYGKAAVRHWLYELPLKVNHLAQQVSEEVDEQPNAPF